MTNLSNLKLCVSLFVWYICSVSGWVHIVCVNLNWLNTYLLGWTNACHRFLLHSQVDRLSFTSWLVLHILVHHDVICRLVAPHKQVNKLINKPVCWHMRDLCDTNALFRDTCYTSACTMWHVVPLSSLYAIPF